jgi:hypothetical protein
VTPAFMAAKYPDGTPYVEEAHAELAFDWVAKAGTAPDGLDMAQLEADLTAVVSPTPPSPTPSPGPKPPGATKRELAKQLNARIRLDVANTRMTEAAMKADLQKVLNAN